MMRLVSRAISCSKGFRGIQLVNSLHRGTVGWHAPPLALANGSLRVSQQQQQQQRQLWSSSKHYYYCSFTPIRSISARAAGGSPSAEGEFEEQSEGDDFEDDWEEFEDDVGHEISTGNLDWGEKALAAARELLLEQEAFADIELFSLRAIPSGKRVDVRLDKMTDLYGSPSMDDIESFSRAFNSRMEEVLGEEAAGEIEVEVSSPGAERAVRIPAELERFMELPMKVEFTTAEDDTKIDTRVLQLEGYDAEAGVSRWRVANVRVNRGQGGKGRGLTKKQRDQVFEIPVGGLRRVNLHLDM